MRIFNLLVPPGRVSKNTLSFLMKLKDPKYNDRTWYVFVSESRMAYKSRLSIGSN